MYTTLYTEAEAYKSIHFSNSNEQKKKTYMQLFARKCYSSVNMKFIICATVDYLVRCCGPFEQNNEVHSGIHDYTAKESWLHQTIASPLFTFIFEAWQEFPCAYTRENQGRRNGRAFILYFLYNPFLTLFSFFFTPDFRWN